MRRTMSPRSPGKHALVFVAITVLLDAIGFGLILPVLPTLLVQLTGAAVSRAAIYGGWLSFVYATMQFLCAPVLGNLSDRFGRRRVLLFAAATLCLANFAYGTLVLPESLPPEKRRRFDWKRANPLGTLLQMRRRPVVRGVLVALFLWMLANQVMPATWSFYTKLRFGWS